MSKEIPRSYFTACLCAGFGVVPHDLFGHHIRCPKSPKDDIVNPENTNSVWRVISEKGVKYKVLITQVGDQIDIIEGPILI